MPLAAADSPQSVGPPVLAQAAQTGYHRQGLPWWCPVVKTLASNARAIGSIPGWGTKILRSHMPHSIAKKYKVTIRIITLKNKY